MKNESRLGKLAVWILLAAGAVVSLIPFWWLVRSSFMDSSDIFVFPPKIWPSHMLWSNYYQAMTAFPFLTYLKNTLIILVPTMIGTVLSSNLCAYGFAKLNYKGRNVWFTLIIATMMLPGAVTLIPTFIMWRHLNCINTYYPLVVPAFFGGGAFNIFLLRQFYMTIPNALEEAALIDGATYTQIFFKVMLPLTKPATIVVSLFTFLGVWNDFFGPLIYINDDSKYTLAIGL